MKTRNKISLILLLLSALLAAGVNVSYCEAPKDTAAIEIDGTNLDSYVDEAIENSTREVVTPKVEDIKVMTPNANKEVKNDVLNDNDTGLKFTLKKFACAMAGVVISSVVIFIILVIMNKIHDFQTLKFKRKEEDTGVGLLREDIAVSGNENEALKIFFEKTK